MEDDDCDGLIDSLDDGTIPLAPFQFDPLCELSGDTYPRNGTEYDDYYEWCAFDDVVVNEMVRL